MFGHRTPQPTADAEPPLAWDFAALTDTGRVRGNNEDALVVDAGRGLAVLADGMGGYAGGEVASGMAVALLQAQLGRRLAQAGPQAPLRAVLRAIQTSVDEANSAILQAGSANLQLQGMGTTVVLGVFAGRRAVVGHIGDSRCYRLRGAELTQLTRDHSMLRELVDAGHITEDQAQASPHRNLVTRALGIERAVEIEVHSHEVQAGDLYLLCSDGLTEMATDAQLVTLLTYKRNLIETATLLVAFANENGGKDNISVVLARASGPDAGAGDT